MDLLAVIGWPILDRIRLGPLAVSPHGLGIAAGYLAGSWWMLREGKKRGLDEDKIGTILLWALVGAIFGARFFYVLAHFNEYDSFVDMLKIWEGGISLIGGITGAMAFAYPIMRRNGYRFLQVMDSGALGLAFGIAVGRIGDLVIGDHLGKPTDFFLGWAYRGGQLPGPWVETAPGEWTAQLSGNLVETISRDGSQLIDGTSLIQQGAGVHQTALYDLLIALGLFLFLRWLSRVPRREGVLIMSFAIWYGAGRIITDFLRVDKTFFGLTGSQWAAVLAIVLSLLFLWRYRRRPLKPEVDLPADDEAEGDRPDTAPVRASGGDDPERERPTTAFTPPEEPGGSSPRN